VEDEQAKLNCPIIVPIPGIITGPRNYRFLNRIDELIVSGRFIVGGWGTYENRRYF
jgi:hypothetical protein